MKPSETINVNSASDTEELIKKHHRPYGSPRLNLQGHECSYNWLRQINYQDGSHLPESKRDKVENYKNSTSLFNQASNKSNDPDQKHPVLPYGLDRLKRLTGADNKPLNDDADRIYGIVSLPANYLYQQFLPSKSANHKLANDKKPNLSGTISAPPGTPIKLPYATPSSFVDQNNYFGFEDNHEIQMFGQEKSMFQLVSIIFI